jgi:Zn-finger nucleic acid-binding protein
MWRQFILAHAPHRTICSWLSLRQLIGVRLEQERLDADLRCSLPTEMLVPLLMCPNCQSNMQSLSRANVEFDMCPSCRGVWLDRGELEKIIEGASAGAYPAAADNSRRPLSGEGSPTRSQDRRAQYRERGEYGERSEHGERGGYGERGESVTTYADAASVGSISSTSSISASARRCSAFPAQTL